MTIETDDATIAGQFFIGWKLDNARLAAEESGWIIRVTTRDGVSQIGTADMRDNRLNVEVENGKITKYVGNG